MRLSYCILSNEEYTIQTQKLLLDFNPSIY